MADKKQSGKLGGSKKTSSSLSSKKKSSSEGSKSGGMKTRSSSTKSASSSGSLGGNKRMRSTADLPHRAITTDSLSEEMQANVADLQSSLEDLQGQASFSGHKETIAELDAGMSDLDERVERLRQRGYQYKSYLEKKVDTVRSKWALAKPAAQAEMEKAEAALGDSVYELSDNLAKTVRSGREREVTALQTEASAMETRISELDNAIDAHYNEVYRAFWQTKQQLDQVEWTLDQVDQAVFELLHGEHPIEAVDAQWFRDGDGDGPSGVLYLTDQRLIFEQKEKVATKKVLFIATEKEMVQEFLFEAPIMSVETVVASTQGKFLKKERQLEFELGSGAEFARAVFKIKGDDPEMWVALVKRVKNGQINTERVGGEVAPADAEETIADLPDACTACGAPLPMIAQGQRQIECEYCGNTIRW